MIQAGGYTADFTEKRTTLPPVAHEGESSRKAGLSNVPGTVAMARTSDPQSANAQFFINVADNSRLNFREPSPQGYGYTVFGKVVDGMDVVNKIAATPTGSGRPVSDRCSETTRADQKRDNGHGIEPPWSSAHQPRPDHARTRRRARHRKPSPTSWPTFAPALRQHAVPSRHRRLHDSRRRLRSRFTQKPVRAPIANEATNGLKNAHYTVAMARTSDPHSATAQFFHQRADNAFLDHRSPDAKGWGYCVFGKVVGGTDVVDLLPVCRPAVAAGIRTYRRQTS